MVEFVEGECGETIEIATAHNVFAGSGKRQIVTFIVSLISLYLPALLSTLCR